MELLDLLTPNMFNFSLPDFGNMDIFNFTKRTLFLIFNASIIWTVLSYVLLRILRLKVVTLILIFAPFLFTDAIENNADLSEIMGFYTVSLIYGGVGIIVGFIIGEYHKARAYFRKGSKAGFAARGAMSLSGVYLLTSYGKQILFENAMVTSAMSFLGLGDANELASIDPEGMSFASTVFFSGLGISLIDKYKKHIPTQWIKNTVSEKAVSTGKSMLAGDTPLPGKKVLKVSRGLSIVFFNRFKRLPWVQSVITELDELDAKETKESKNEEK